MTPPARSNITITRSHHAPSTPTRRLCEACTLLGVSAPDVLSSPPPNPSSFTLDLSPSTITLIIGASGSGKSTLLRDIARAARAAGLRVIKPSTKPMPDKPAIDIIGDDASGAMRALACAGLAEASCFARRPKHLSEGQRWRLRLAATLARASRSATPSRPAVVIYDEFASNLDPRTGSSLAHLARTFADRDTKIAMVIASPRADIAPSLAPDSHIECLHANQLRVTHAPMPRTQSEFVIVPGNRADYDALSHLHYRAGPPATIARILVARDANAGQLAGVLVTSMPTLNASWREYAWPGRYSSASRKENAERINDELRCISRVIVDPACRSMGVARRLVGAYLDHPDTPSTEALAAMGHACPFFERAGMTPYTLAPTARDARLLDALTHAGVERWRLALPDQALARATTSTSPAFIERETRRWARCSGATARHARDDLPALFARACGSIAARPVAYAHTARSR